MIDNIHVQAALTAQITGFLSAYELILSVGHDSESDIRALDYSVKVSRLRVGFQHDLFLASHLAVGGIGQTAHHFEFFLKCRLILSDLPQLGEIVLIDRQSRGKFLVFGLQRHLFLFDFLIFRCNLFADDLRCGRNLPGQRLNLSVGFADFLLLLCQSVLCLA